MQYVFMHNFRGFTDTLLPLKQLTFLVGENSTGKSSFLKLIYLLSRPEFWFSPERAFQEYAELGGFEDIVSAWAKDRSYFQVGAITSENDKKNNRKVYSFCIHTFTKRDGLPYVSRYLSFSEDQLTKIILEQKQAKYKIIKIKQNFANDDDILHFFQRIVKEDRHDKEDFVFFPQKVPSYFPLPLAITILQTVDKDKSVEIRNFSDPFPFSLDLTWIAPIRTKPQRFYDGMRKTFTPEGDHTPFVLRRILRTKAKSVDFAKKLKFFGESSGLYETITPHSFDTSPQSPFEILVKFSGAELNINNVGYGVSQVLPLIVEFLSKDHECTFAVQQPEVHLHPRAQAALGDVVIELARDSGHSFFFETHSDYLIDRCRLNLAKNQGNINAQVIFFQRTSSGNQATVLNIGNDGKYPENQPPEFKDFFIKEEMNLLEI